MKLLAQDKISIVMPTFNSEKYVKRAVLSVLSQTYKNFELIICDNLSKDSTIKIIKLIKKSDRRIRIFVRKDNGVADALNFGFKKAKGKYLCWLNSDDLYFNKFVLKNVILNFKKKSDKCYLVGNFINIDDKNKLINKFYSFIPQKKINKYFYFNQIFTGAFFFKSEIFIDFKRFNTKYKFAFEYDLIFFIFKNYYGIYLNKTLACFRILPCALSSNKVKLKKEKLSLLKKYRLICLNFILIRIYYHLKNGNLFKVIKYRLFQKYMTYHNFS